MDKKELAELLSETIGTVSFLRDLVVTEGTINNEENAEVTDLLTRLKKYKENLSKLAS